jgi:predicted permease
VGLRHVAGLVLSNALMWTTGAAIVLSMLGLHALLDPDVPTHIPALEFVEGTLSWLARCSVPVSLFAVGLWTCGRAGELGYGAWRSTLVYTAIKLLLLPGLMVFVNSLLGLDGKLARAMVVLTCVPVGQMAFVVSEQYGQGTDAVTGVMQLGLLLMLPHVLGVMAVLRWLGLYEEGA